MSKMSALIICQTIEYEVYYSTTKKKIILQLPSMFLVRVFRNTLIPALKMTLTMNKMFAGIICQTIDREVDYSNAKNKCYFRFYFLVRVSKTS